MCGAIRTSAYKGARIIFLDTEKSNWAWDPISKAFYWHRFFSHQPDLNYDNPAVREQMWKVMKFWLEMGVDGVPVGRRSVSRGTRRERIAKICRRRTR